MFNEKLKKAKEIAKKLGYVLIGTVIGITWFYDIQMYFDILHDLK